MNQAVGTWSRVEVAGHECDVYRPPRAHPDRRVVVYLHGVHLNRLDDKPAFTRQFDRHGLIAVCPRGA